MKTISVLRRRNIVTYLRLIDKIYWKRYNTLPLQSSVYNKNRDITNNCKIILSIQSIMYLGITFDNRLRWNLHINHLTKRVRVPIHHFYKLHLSLPKYNIQIFYVPFYEAVVQYGIEIWRDIFDSAIKLLLQQQNIMISVWKIT